MKMNYIAACVLAVDKIDKNSSLGKKGIEQFEEVEKQIRELERKAEEFDRREKEMPIKAIKSGFDEWFGRTYKCSVCGEDNIWKWFKYCPDCGRKLESIESEGEC